MAVCMEIYSCLECVYRNDLIGTSCPHPSKRPTTQERGVLLQAKVLWPPVGGRVRGDVCRVRGDECRVRSAG